MSEFDFYPLGAFEPYAPGRMRLYGGKDTPAPDPRIGQAAENQMDLAQRQYEDFRSNFAPVILEQMNRGLDLTDRQEMRARQMQDYQLGRAEKYDQRWDKVQVPLEDKLIAQAQAYNTEDERQRMAGEALGDVNMQFANARGQAERNMGRMGINPNSGAYAAMQTQTEQAQALAAASAMTKTREAARQIGWSRLGEAAALGRGLPGFGASSAGLSMGAGGMASGLAMQGGNIAGNASAQNNAGYGMGSQLYGSAGNMLNGQFQTISGNQNAANNAQGQATGAVTGAIITGALAAMSDRRLKTDIQRVGTLDSGLPVYTYRFKSGGPVQMGVMADEVAILAPHAYVPDAVDGYDAVKYGEL